MKKKIIIIDRGKIDNAYRLSIFAYILKKKNMIIKYFWTTRLIILKKYINSSVFQIFLIHIQNKI